MDHIKEIKDEKDLVRRNMLLQKYGIIPPKLTEEEQSWIHIEQMLASGPWELIWTK